ATPLVQLAGGGSITAKDLLRQGLPRQLAGSDCLTFPWGAAAASSSCRGAGRIQRESTTMRRRSRASSGAKCGGQPPKLVCALAASLVASMCGLRCMVGSFLVPCPRHGPLSSTPPPRLPSSHRRRAGRNVASVALNRERVDRGGDAEEMDGDDDGRGGVGGSGGGGLDRAG
ncbi:unnamed protein product, partial [Ectocarpus fasciculatus]